MTYLQAGCCLGWWRPMPRRRGSSQTLGGAAPVPSARPGDLPAVLPQTCRSHLAECRTAARWSCLLLRCHLQGIWPPIRMCQGKLSVQSISCPNLTLCETCCWPGSRAGAAVILGSAAAPVVGACLEQTKHGEPRTPVSMRTEMPARWQAAMAAGTSSRSGSSMPTSATSVSSFSSWMIKIEFLVCPVPFEMSKRAASGSFLVALWYSWIRIIPCGFDPKLLTRTDRNSSSNHFSMTPYVNSSTCAALNSSRLSSV